MNVSVKAAASICGRSAARNLHVRTASFSESTADMLGEACGCNRSRASSGGMPASISTGWARAASRVTCKASTLWSKQWRRSCQGVLQALQSSAKQARRRGLLRLDRWPASKHLEDKGGRPAGEQRVCDQARPPAHVARHLRHERNIDRDRRHCPQESDLQLALQSLPRSIDPQYVKTVRPVPTHI